MTVNSLSWSFGQIWNQSLDIGRPERILEPRNHIWASELGGSMIDRYLKMKAVEPTNPPNDRSKRKFEGGNIWEFIVRLVLLRAGIMRQAQQRIAFKYDGLLEVTGKLDFLAGGVPNYDVAEKNITELEELGLPEFVTRTTSKVIEFFSQNYPDGLPELPLEIKSCSASMFDKYEQSGRANPNHRLQAFHYIKGDNRPEGHIVYICRDDARILELGVFNPSDVEMEYKKDIKTLTGYFESNQEPPKEKFIVFDEDFGKFSCNWKVTYSQYLTMLYGFESPSQFDNTFKAMSTRWNRVLGRIATGKDMTKNNLEALGEIKKFGFNVDEIVEKTKLIKNL